MKVRFYAACILFALFPSLGPALADPPASGERSPDLACAIDVSLSMRERNRLENVKQAAKLGCQILDGSVQFIAFSDDARLSPLFDLRSQRDAAITWVDHLRPLAGTKYLPALERAAESKPKAILFLSDGQPNEPPDEVLQAVSKVRSTIDTIGVDTDPPARNLLANMAAATGGGFHAVEDPAKIVDIFLEILAKVRPFRLVEVAGSSLTIDDIRGEVLAIGFDAVPTVDGQTTWTATEISGRKIYVVRTTISRSNVRVTLDRQTPKARGLVLRFDSAVAKLTLGPPAFRGGKGHFTAAVAFESGGKLVDPRKPGSRLSVDFEVLDAAGNVVVKAPGQPSATRPALEANIEVPIQQGANPAPLVVRAISKDGSSGAAFVATESRAIVVDPAVPAPVEPPKPVVGPDALQLLVAAHRTTSGRVVLFDSSQKVSELGVAYDGDSISLELVRTDAIDPREFASLGKNLRARLLSDDGAVADVPLVQHLDRFVTDSRRVKGPGRLRVQVDVVMGGLDVQLVGQVAIDKILARLALAPSPIVRKLSALPSGAIVPFEVGVTTSTVLAGQPTRPETLEAMRRSGLAIRWTLCDGAGVRRAGETQPADLKPWTTQMKLGDAGQSQWTVDLIDADGALHDSLTWPFVVAPSPVSYGVRCQTDERTVDARAHPWLPRWCVARSPLQLTARPIRSPLLSTYYVADVRVGEMVAKYDESAGEFTAAIEAGNVELVAIIRPYGFGTPKAGNIPELRIAETMIVPVHEEILWTRVIATGVGLAVGVGGLVAAIVWTSRWLLRRKLAAVGLRARLHGTGESPKLLVDPANPNGELLIAIKPSAQGSFHLTRACGEGEVAIARLRQRCNGSVEFVGLIDKLMVKKGQVVELSLPKKRPSLRLSSAVTLVVEKPFTQK